MTSAAVKTGGVWMGRPGMSAAGIAHFRGDEDRTVHVLVLCGSDAAIPMARFTPIDGQ
jgi:hypothetical protein